MHGANQQNFYEKILIFGPVHIDFRTKSNQSCFDCDGCCSSSEWLLFPVALADDPSLQLGKQVRHFRFIFTYREARGKNKQKIPKSPRTSERKALRSKA